MCFIFAVEQMPSRRILILYNRVPYPLNDGGNIAVNAMIEGYKREGWQVYVLAMNTTRHPIADETLKNIYTDIYAFEVIPVDNGINTKGIVANYLFSTKPNHVQRFFVPAFADRLVEILRQFTPDVVQMESVFLSSYIPMIRKNSNAKLALRMHNVEGQIWARLATETANLLKRIYLRNLAERIRKYEIAAWKNYDLLIGITSTDSAEVKKHIPTADVITIPVGIEVGKLVANNNRNSDWIGYHIGAMDWLPNKEAMQWFIKDIWPLVHRRTPHFLFEYAGRNMPVDMKMLQGEGVVCVGEVADAAGFIADKKILIVPLRSGGGIRVKILEAMAAEKLVICTGIAIQGIDATAGVHFLLADTEQGFADAIAWALEHKTEAETIAHNAATLVKTNYNAASLGARLSHRLLAML